MRNIALIALVFIACGALASHHTDRLHLNDIWTQWRLKYNKIYETVDEESYRFGIWSANYKIITEWNAGNHTSTMAANMFADLTDEEFSSIYLGGNLANRTLGHIDWNTNRTSWPHPHPRPPVPLPASWDWRTLGGVTNVKNQEGCGADYAFAAMGAIETTWFTMGNMLTSFSEQQIIDCDQNDRACDGGDVANALTYAEEEGDEPLSDYPYSAGKTKCKYNQENAENVTSGGVSARPNNATDFMLSIVFNPTAVIVNADEPVFKFYSSGVITTNCSAITPDHWVLAVGYGTNYSNTEAYYIKNSWGTTWGDGGYVYIGNSTEENPAGLCGIFTQPIFPFPNMEIPAEKEEENTETESSFFI